MKQHKKIDLITSIYELIYRGKNISKKDIAVELDISPPLVTKYTKLLEGTNLIFLGKKGSSNKAGRKKTFLQINKNISYTLGIDIKMDTIEYKIVNLIGEVIYEEQSLIFYKNNIKTFIEKLSNKINSLINIIEKKRRIFLGVGISIIGMVKDGKTLSSIGYWFKEVDLVKSLKETVKYPIILYNNVSSLAIYENFLNPYLNKFFFIKYDRGIGGSLYIKGIEKNGVEFGHFIVDEKDYNYCPICKRRGCLESLISIEKILGDIKKNFTLHSYPILYDITDGKKELISLQTYLKSVELGGIQENLSLRQSAKLMALSLLNVSNFVPVEKIVLHGLFFKNKIYMNHLNLYLNDFQILDYSHKLVESSIPHKTDGIAPAMAFNLECFKNLIIDRIKD